MDPLELKKLVLIDIEDTLSCGRMKTAALMVTRMSAREELANELDPELVESLVVDLERCASLDKENSSMFLAAASALDALCEDAEAAAVILAKQCDLELSDWIREVMAIYQGEV